MPRPNLSRPDHAAANTRLASEVTMARNIIFAVELVNGRPDVGPTLRDLMVQTAPGVWVGSQGPHALCAKDETDITVNGTNYRIFSGQVSTPQTFAFLQNELGVNRVWTAKQARETPAVWNRLQSLVKKIRRKSDGAIVGFVAKTCIAGQDPLTPGLDDSDNPDDFEELDDIT